MKTKHLIFTIIVITILLVACRQNKDSDSKFNLDFEKIDNGFPVGWKISDNGLINTISLDSIEVKSGKYAVVIESKGNMLIDNSLAFTLPHDYGGKQITLSGYIKTENVTEGYAGLWMAILPSVAYNDMEQEKLTGTNEWKKFEIRADLYPAITEKIVVGGHLSGKGKMWIDDLKITIDDKDIQNLKPYKPKVLPAEKDKKFDSGSKIVFPELDEQKISDLELLGRIWGFLKYHHPAIAAGKYNWDYELFRILPDYLKINDTNRRDRILLNWIKKYGNVPACKTCTATPDSAFLKPDLSWIDNSTMNRKLRALLQNIYLNRQQGSHYYIHSAAYVGNPMFLHENDYPEMPYPDAGFRLLALYRYWNMIHYFFPYKYQTDKDWNTVLKEYIPLFIAAKNELEYEFAVTQLIGAVCDTHAGLENGDDKIDSLRGNKRVPVQLQWIENKWVVKDYRQVEGIVHSYAKIRKKTGLEIGDIITHINTQPVESIVDSIKKYYPASNEAARMRNIANDLLRSNSDRIHINYISSNSKRKEEKELTCLYNRKLIRYKKNYAKCYKFLNENIGYITLESIKNADIPIIKKEFKNTKGIIIDIRNYPATFVPFSLGSYFVSAPTPFVKFTRGNANNPGEFTFTQDLEIPKPEETYRGKLVVLVNEFTISQSEYTAMAFQAGDNTTVIGSTTAGADGNVSEITLPGGLSTSISGIGVYYPDGRETQRVGIIPDIEVNPTIKGIREGRDEVLEKAIEIIAQEKKKD